MLGPAIVLIGLGGFIVLKAKKKEAEGGDAW